MATVNKFSQRFEKIVSETIKLETGGDKTGAYHHDPDDKGGATKWGISDRADGKIDGHITIANILVKPIKDLTYKDAISIYYEGYWNQFYELLTSEKIAFKLFDLGVLFGIKTTVEIMQDVILQYRVVKPDGNFGPITLTALNDVLLNASEAQILREFQDFMLKRVERLTRWPSKNKKFRQGWINRINYEYNPKVVK